MKNINDSHIADAVDPISLLTARERIELVRNELQEQLLTSAGDTLEFSRSHVEIYCHALDAALVQPAPASAVSAQPVEVADARAAFEAWARSEGHDCARSDLGGYIFGATHSAWKGWQAALAHPRPTSSFDFAAHLQRQREWSGKTFGPSSRAQGVVDHIRKELKEIEADPGDLKEWIDVVILALDGAWRSGAQPKEIVDALVAKQTKNEGRVWPDWRTADPNKAIEHDRSHDAPEVPRG